MSVGSCSETPPVLRNTIIRRVAVTAFGTGVLVSVAAAFGYASVPEGFYAFVSSIVLGWMAASKGGEIVAYKTDSDRR